MLVVRLVSHSALFDEKYQLGVLFIAGHMIYRSLFICLNSTWLLTPVHMATRFLDVLMLHIEAASNARMIFDMSLGFPFLVCIAWSSDFWLECGIYSGT